MASARPSAFKKGGGGFLNNVDGVFADYNFTTDPPFERKAKKGSDWNPLFAVVTAQVDGADEPVTTTISVGSADDFEIEDDGKTLVPVDDNVQLPASFGWGILIESLVAAGFPESNLPEDRINYEAILGTRVRFSQRKNEVMAAKGKKRKDKKTGKEYDYTDLVVSQVYALPEAEEAPKGKSSSKTSKAAAGGKTNGKAKEVSVEEQGAEILLSILNANEGSLPKSKLPVKLAGAIAAKDPRREELRKLIYSDDFLSEEMGWTYDKSSKTQVIELAE